MMDRSEEEVVEIGRDNKEIVPKRGVVGLKRTLRSRYLFTANVVKLKLLQVFRIS